MHSLWLDTDFEKLSKHFRADVIEKDFLTLFQARLKDPKIKICKGVEGYFYKLSSEFRSAIDSHRELSVKSDEAEIEKQKARIKAAEEKLKKKKTKTAQLDKERGERKIEKLEKSIYRTQREEVMPWEARIFPLYFAPMITVQKGALTIKPFRFHFRPHDRDESYDREYDTYKARRESLTEEYFDRIRTQGKTRSIWAPVFGAQHGLVAIKKFFENIPMKKAKGGRPRVVGFEPQSEETLFVPTLYDVWGKGKKRLSSFAIVTQEAPPEVEEAGYHRCPIFLRSENILPWLNPEGQSNEELHLLLTDPQESTLKEVA